MNRNTGNYNTGDYNTGNYNTRDYNTGNYNTRDRNTGDRNTGDRNTGDRNTGDCNTGNCNTGDCNTGNCNTGDYNTGNYNTGFFCTNTPNAVLFDMPSCLTIDEVLSILPCVNLIVSCEFVDKSEMTDQEKVDNPKYSVFGGYLKKINKKIQEVFPIWWESTTQENRDKFLNLPNFDAEKFLKCTGVDVRKNKVDESGINERIIQLQKELEELKNHLRKS